MQYRKRWNQSAFCITLKAESSMSKLEQAIIDARSGLSEYGLSREASRAARIFQVKVRSSKRSAEPPVSRMLEQSTDRELLERVRTKAKQPAPAE